MMIRNFLFVEWSVPLKWGHRYCILCSKANTSSSQLIMRCWSHSLQSRHTRYPLGIATQRGKLSHKQLWPTGILRLLSWCTRSALLRSGKWTRKWLNSSLLACDPPLKPCPLTTVALCRFHATSSVTTSSHVKLMPPALHSSRTFFHLDATPRQVTKRFLVTLEWDPSVKNTLDFSTYIKSCFPKISSTPNPSSPVLTFFK